MKMKQIDGFTTIDNFAVMVHPGITFRPTYAAYYLANGYSVELLNAEDDKKRISIMLEIDNSSSDREVIVTIAGNHETGTKYKTRSDHGLNYLKRYNAKSLRNILTQLEQTIDEMYIMRYMSRDDLRLVDGGDDLDHDTLFRIVRNIIRGFRHDVANCFFKYKTVMATLMKYTDRPDELNKQLCKIAYKLVRTEKRTVALVEGDDVSIVIRLLITKNKTKISPAMLIYDSLTKMPKSYDIYSLDRVEFNKSFKDLSSEEVIEICKGLIKSFPKDLLVYIRDRYADAKMKEYFDGLLKLRKVVGNGEEVSDDLAKTLNNHGFVSALRLISTMLMWYINHNYEMIVNSAVDVSIVTMRMEDVI